MLYTKEKVYMWGKYTEICIINLCTMHAALFYSNIWANTNKLLQQCKFFGNKHGFFAS